MPRDTPGASQGISVSSVSGPWCRKAPCIHYLLVNELLNEANEPAGAARHGGLAVAQVDQVAAELLHHDESTHERRARLHRPEAAAGGGGRLAGVG